MVSISASAIAPIAYLILVLGSLSIFSTVYRRRKARQSSSLEPWFPPNRQRDIYLTLLHLDPACPPKALKAALLERAREDISRIYSLREAKTAATALLQKGSISEDTFSQIVAAETEMNVEIADVMAEARALGGEDWGQNILPQANEFYQKANILKTVERCKKLAETERKKWDEEQLVREKLRERQREIALKELDLEDNTVKTTGMMNGEVMEGEIPTPPNGATESAKKRKKKK
jgi:translocation protein SEC66